MQCPLIRMAKNQLSVSATGAMQRISKLLFVWQPAEVDDRVPLREPRCGREERLLERGVLAGIEPRRTARCSRVKRFQLGAGKSCGGWPIGKPQIPPTE